MRKEDIVSRERSVPGRLTAYRNYEVLKATEHGITVLCDDGVERAYPRVSWHLVRSPWLKVTVYSVAHTLDGRVINVNSFNSPFATNDFIERQTRDFGNAFKVLARKKLSYYVRKPQ